LKKLNPNVECPAPKILKINKVAIDLADFDENRDEWRQQGKEVVNLD
jgi:hypothetical protein